MNMHGNPIFVRKDVKNRNKIKILFTKLAMDGGISSLTFGISMRRALADLELTRVAGVAATTRAREAADAVGAGAPVGTR